MVLIRVIVILSFFLSYLSVASFGQTPKKTYTIRGQVSFVSRGILYLYAPIDDKRYYGDNPLVDSAEISAGKFSLVRKVNDAGSYPYSLYIKSQSSNGPAGLVFIGSGDQFLKIDSLGEYNAARVTGSPVQTEYSSSYIPNFKSVIQRAARLEDHRNALVNKYGDSIPNDEKNAISRESDLLEKSGDSILFEYVASHPSSYVALWKLLERVVYNGYKEGYEYAFKRLSPEIKNSVTGQLLGKDLSSLQMFSFRRRFPDLRLPGAIHRSEKKYLSEDYGSQVTLLLLWFSRCRPCLEEMPLLSDLYDKYRGAGFQIIGVSVDEEKEFANLETLIRNRKLNWPQYLDTSGQFFERSGIHSFPANFLLDPEGLILNRNVSPDALEAILNARFKDLYKNESIDPQ